MTTTGLSNQSKVDKAAEPKFEKFAGPASTGLTAPIEPVLLADAGLTDPKKGGAFVGAVVGTINRTGIPLPGGGATRVGMSGAEAMSRQDGNVSAFIDSVAGDGKEFRTDNFKTRGTGTEPSPGVTFFNAMTALQLVGYRPFMNEAQGVVVFFKDGKQVNGVSLPFDTKAMKDPDKSQALYRQKTQELVGVAKLMGVDLNSTAQAAWARTSTPGVPAGMQPPPAVAAATASNSFKDINGKPSFELKPEASTGHKMVSDFLAANADKMKNVTATWVDNAPGGAEVLKFKYTVTSAAGRVQEKEADLNVTGLMDKTKSAQAAAAFMDAVGSTLPAAPAK